MDKKDALFVAHLRKNARATLTDISRRTGIPISTLFDRLHQLEERLVLKHTSLVDFAKLGFGCRASIVLKVGRERRDDLKAYLAKHPAVNSLLKINNGFDLMVEGIFIDVKALEFMLEDLEQKFPIIEKHVYYIIEDIAREHFLADPQLVRLLEIPSLE